MQFIHASRSQQQRFAHKRESCDSSIPCIVNNWCSPSIGSSFGDYGSVSRAAYQGILVPLVDFYLPVAPKFKIIATIIVCLLEYMSL